MNKKEARIQRQRRGKTRAQIIRSSKRKAERQKLIAAFKVAFAFPSQIESIAKSCQGEICYLCNKRVFKKDLKAKRFIALTTKKTEMQMEYVLHFSHFLLDDLTTPTADAKANFEIVYHKIRGAELKDILAEEKNDT